MEIFHDIERYKENSSQRPILMGSSGCVQHRIIRTKPM